MLARHETQLCTALWNNYVARSIIAGRSVRRMVLPRVDSFSLFPGWRCVHEKVGTVGAGGVRRSVRFWVPPAAESQAEAADRRRGEAGRRRAAWREAG